MKIAEITCGDCKAKFETLDSIPEEMLSCVSCGSKNLKKKVTKKEFEGGCGGGCGDCSSCK
jgi:DNA-directed RNA polymerase subunit RPC12/RpoP